MVYGVVFGSQQRTCAEQKVVDQGWWGDVLAGGCFVLVLLGVFSILSSQIGHGGIILPTSAAIHLACVLAGSPTSFSLFRKESREKRVAADFRWWVVWSRYEEMVSGKYNLF